MHSRRQRPSALWWRPSPAGPRPSETCPPPSHMRSATAAASQHECSGVVKATRCAKLGCAAQSAPLASHSAQAWLPAAFAKSSPAREFAGLAAAMCDRMDQICIFLVPRRGLSLAFCSVLSIPPARGSCRGWWLRRATGCRASGLPPLPAAGCAGCPASPAGPRGRSPPASRPDACVSVAERRPKQGSSLRHGAVHNL